MYLRLQPQLFFLFQDPYIRDLRSDCTLFQSDSLSPNDLQISGVITFVTEELFFTKLSTQFVFSFDPYSDYAGMKIFLQNSPPMSMLKLFYIPFKTLPDTFFNPILLSFGYFFILGIFDCHHLFWDLRDTPDPHGEELFNGVISYDLFHLNNPDSSHFFSSGSRFSPDISFVL